MARSHYYFSLPPDMEASVFAFDLHTEANNVTEGYFRQSVGGHLAMGSNEPFVQLGRC